MRTFSVSGYLKLLVARMAFDTVQDLAAVQGEVQSGIREASCVGWRRGGATAPKDQNGAIVAWVGKIIISIRSQFGSNRR